MLVFTFKWGLFCSLKALCQLLIWSPRNGLQEFLHPFASKTLLGSSFPFCGLEHATISTNGWHRASLSRWILRLILNRNLLRETWKFTKRSHAAIRPRSIRLKLPWSILTPSLFIYKLLKPKLCELLLLHSWLAVHHTGRPSSQQRSVGQRLQPLGLFYLDLRVLNTPYLEVAVSAHFWSVHPTVAGRDVLDRSDGVQVNDEAVFVICCHFEFAINRRCSCWHFNFNYIEFIEFWFIFKSTFF